MEPAQILLRDQYGRIIKRELRWWIPVQALARLEHMA